MLSLAQVSKKVFLVCMFFALLSLVPSGALAQTKDLPGVKGTLAVSVLVYHRFGPVVADSMTVTTSVFASHLKMIQEAGFTVIPLRRLVDALQGQGDPLPSRSVVITVDDGHLSVYTEMYPLIRKAGIPVTLFIYPSAISNASYAMSWEQLKELQDTGKFDIQSHTYWHPNFKQDRKRLSAAEFDESVNMQLNKSKAKLEQKMGTEVNLLAWPFGIFDEQLVSKAAEAGYRAAFSIERRPVAVGDRLLSLPRFLINDADRGENYLRILTGSTAPNALTGNR